MSESTDNVELAGKAGPQSVKYFQCQLQLNDEGVS
jgi:hypothetical protein